MKRVLLLLFFFGNLTDTFAQSKDEKINVSYWYVFGRFPNTNEMAYWRSQPDQSINWYISNHHNYLKADDGSSIQAVSQSYKDAFGRQPIQGEMDFWKKQKKTYSDLMSQHVQYLLRDPSENTATINRAYQTVYGRVASTEEMNNWNKANFSYLILTACLRSYKSNGYRLQSVEGMVNFIKGAWETTSNFAINTGSAIYNAAASAISATVATGQRILTLGTSVQITKDLRSIDSFVMSITENGLTLITGGASYMRGLNKLIGLDGGTLIGVDGGTLIGERGAALIAAGGLN